MTLHPAETLGVVNVKDSNDNLVGVAAKFWNEFTWGKNIADKLNLNLINDSTGGASNDRIVRTTVDYVRNLTPDQRKHTLVIIGWSNADRNEICVKDTHDVPGWFRFNTTRKFSETLTLDHTLSLSQIERIDKVHKLWMTEVFSEYERIHRYMQGVYLLSNLLENLGIRYYFFNALPIWYVFSDEILEQRQIDFGDWLGWHDSHTNIQPIHDTMQYFIHEHGYKLAPGKHPLVDGHRAWAEHLIHAMKDRNIV